MKTTKKTQKEKLAEGYLPVFRIVEIGSTLTFASAGAWTAWRMRFYAQARPDLALGAWLAGWLAADFVSGLVHWMGDTWGTTDWLLIGQTLIRTFREHHVDQEAITRHDFIETNGTNCLISLPILFWCLWVTPGFFPLMMFSMILWVFATNQIHKWAHSRANPAWVAWLQRSGLILSPEHHATHHQAPFIDYYCITTGWLNRPLSVLGFFRRAESVVTAVTGALPREHDTQVTDTALGET